MPGSTPSQPASPDRQDGEREERGPLGIKPGLALTSCPRPTLTVAEALLLPPLLLTSTSLCRKVDQAPRLSLRLSVVKGVLKSETEAQRSERVGRRGTGAMQRHRVPRAKGGAWRL